ncbi:bcl-2-related ovarian killer protein homolog B-like [Antedon mediterranea]|uniref:bcl-2-related ovarian killer protein homolog B-like n=1 Tax=Antedon mediterranea TaxID=105859 RepID=UPI003AF6EA70
MTDKNDTSSLGLGLGLGPNSTTATSAAETTSWSDMTPNVGRTGRKFSKVFLAIQAKISHQFNDFPSVSEEQIVLQTKYICRDYIYSKLKSLKLVQKEIHKDGKYSDISRELIKVGQEYETMYPNLFADVCGYLKMNFEHEEHVQGVFNAVASEIIGRGISWARIVSLFAFTATLAVDCVQQENTRFANLVVDSMQKFTRKRLATWILQRGGWLGMVEYLHNNHQIEPKMWQVRNIASSVVFVSVSVLTILENVACAIIGGDDEIMN